MSAILDPSNSVELAQPRETAVMPGFNSNSSWELAQRIGKAFAASSLVPAAYQNNVANCIVALEMANRMGASPLMVMQNLYIVHGNPGWSSKFLIACFNQSGKFSAMRYEWNPAHTECRAWSIEKATGEKLVGPMVSIEMAKAEGWSTKNGSKWKTMPDLMLMYRAAAFFVRTYAPEISMGLRTDDELIDTEEAPRPAVSGLQSVRAALARAIDTAPTDVDTDTGEIKKTGKAFDVAEAIEMMQSCTSRETLAELMDEFRDAPPAAKQALADAYAARDVALSE